jgi:hypothetical protein
VLSTIPDATVHVFVAGIQLRYQLAAMRLPAPAVNCLIEPAAGTAIDVAVGEASAWLGQRVIRPRIRPPG